MPYCEAHPYGMLVTHSCFQLPNAHPYGMASYLIQQQTFPVGKTARLNLEGKFFFCIPLGMRLSRLLQNSEVKWNSMSGYFSMAICKA
jgi:hypothetical protein